MNQLKSFIFSKSYLKTGLKLGDYVFFEVLILKLTKIKILLLILSKLNIFTVL